MSETHARDPLLAVVESGVEVVDLGRQLRVGMPQSPNHPAFWHTLPRRHGDMVRPDGGSAANDMITTGTHVGTHIDALSHVSHNGKMYGGGIDAEDAGRGGKYEELGVHTIAPMVRRGVLLDIPAAAVSRGARAATRSPSTTSRPRPGPGRRGPIGRRGLIRSGWGAALRRGRAVPGSHQRRPRRRRGRRAVAGRPRRARRRRGHDRLRAVGSRRGTHAAAGPSRPAGRERHLHRRGARPGGAGRAPVPRVHVRARAAEHLRATGSPVRPIAGGDA